MTKLTSLSNISFPLHERKIDLNTGFIVQVYEKKVSILVDSLYAQKNDNELRNAGFFELNYRGGNINTRSKDIETVLTRCLNGDKTTKLQFYYFVSLKDFANAVLQHGWETY